MSAPDDRFPGGSLGDGFGREGRDEVAGLHQPPNPRDLERFPPRSARCASIRGLLRDAADGDLDGAEQALVNEHAQVCRDCSVALARMEHEVYLLRRSLAGANSPGGNSPGGNSPGANSPGGNTSAGPRPGFAGRVVQRLVLDETSMISREMLAALGGPAENAAGTSSAGTSSGGAPSAGRRGASAEVPSCSSARRQASARADRERSRAMPVRSLLVGLSASVLLLVALLTVEVRWGDAFAPQPQGRLVIVGAADTYADYGRPVATGHGVGDAETLMVGGRGSANMDWHDRSTRSQPAAHLQLGSNGQMRLHEGAPMLLRGDVRIESRRPVSVPMADGSAVAFGIGDYRLSVEPDSRVDPDAAWRDMPLDLRVTVEVISGDSAEILRPQWGNTLVADGGLGVYQTNGPTFMDAPARSSGIGEIVAPRQPAPPQVAVEHMLSGTVLERSGVPAVGVDVLMAFALNGGSHSRGARSGADGRFEVVTGGAGLGNFAIVHAVPPTSRTDLGLRAPSAVPVITAGGQSWLKQSVLLDPSSVLRGTVVDQMGQGRHGVRVVPLVVDEWFGSVLVWVDGQVTTGPLGDFRVRRLPFDLPTHQHIALLVLHPDVQTTVAPVPTRGDVAALAPPTTIVVAELRAIDVRGLIPNTNYTVLEEVPGLPAGSAVWQRNVRSSYMGRLDGLRVGGDVLWVQEPGQPTVRELRYSELGLLRVYQPHGLAVQRSAMFRPMDAIPGTDLLVASSFRHALLDADLLVASGGHSVHFVDAGSGHHVPQVELFSVSSAAAGGAGAAGRGATTRFAGFAGVSATGDPTGVEIRSLDPGQSLFALAADGSTGWLDGTLGGLGSAETALVTMRAPGRVLVDEALRPTAGGSAEVIVLRFERAELTLPGLQPVAVRFACAANGWEVSGVPAGEYRVLVGESAYTVEVPAGGWVRLQ